MNIVYLLMNETRFEKGFTPFLYIGSKVDCEVLHNKIIDKKGKEYWSSSNKVKRSKSKGDVWVVFDYVTTPRKYVTFIEEHKQKLVCAKDSIYYYNLTYASGGFNSMRPGTGEKISKAHKGKVRPEMFEEKYYKHLHTPEVIKKNSENRIKNGIAKKVAKERCDRQKKDPEWVKWRAELSSKTFRGKVLTEKEMWLRKHDDRYKSNRKLTNEQVYCIRFGKHRNMSLNELLLIYQNVTKATLCRVKNFKVFKDINEDWTNEK